MNQVVENILKKELQGVMHRWTEFVPYAQLAYNANISTTTGRTPFSLMYGRRLNELENYGKSKSDLMDIEIWKTHQDKLHKVVYPAVSERVLNEKSSTAEKFSRKRRMLKENALPRGALVMMVDKTRESKWDPVYEGPFIIIRRNRGGAYVLKDRLGETLKRTVPADQLKLVRCEGEKAVVETSTFEVSDITGHRYDAARNFEYYVVWKNKDIEPSWKPVANFDDNQCHQKILEQD